MRVFLDFEASSLSRESYPIEVAWVFENGGSEACLIRPAEDWTDWDPAAEAIHRIPRELLEREGVDHGTVARRMVQVLSGHSLFASAPSWDGKWMSKLLRTAGYPRHTLRLGDSDTDSLMVARSLIAPTVPEERRSAVIEQLLADIDAANAAQRPAHRALPDAQQELRRHLAIIDAARALAAAPTEDRAG